MSARNVEEHNIVLYRKCNKGVQTVNRDLEHNILLHEQKLEFLIGNRNFKRPCQSLRLKGLHCFDEKNQIELISKFETLSLEKAIYLKQKEILMLKSEFDAVPKEEWHLYREPNWSNLNLHAKKLRKKMDWLSYCSKTRYHHWPPKGKEVIERQRTKKEVGEEKCKLRNKKKRERR